MMLRGEDAHFALRDDEAIQGGDRRDCVLKRALNVLQRAR